MARLELSVDTTGEAVDWVSALLAEADPAAALRVGPPVEPAWELSVVADLPPTTSPAVIARLHDALASLRRVGLVGDLHVDDAAAPSPDAGAPRPVGDRFVLLAGGAVEAESSGRLPIRIGPGPAFGSGLHPTTVCSLRLLERYAAAGVQALDLGSGSGILSVALARLGARVLALDNDPAAVLATGRAVRRNGVADAVEVAHGSLAAAAELGHWLGARELGSAPAVAAVARFDLIAANVLARLHVGLADDYRTALRGGGLLITSGYTADQAEVVSQRLGEVGLVALERVDEGGYVGQVHRAAA